MKIKDEKEPKVIIGGEVINTKRKYKDSGAIMWGVLLLGGGLVLLLNNMGLVSGNIWNYIWEFWPLLLIFAGLHVILGDNLISNFIIGIFTTASFVLVILYGLDQTDSPLASQLPVWIKDIFNYINSIKK